MFGKKNHGQSNEEQKAQPRFTIVSQEKDIEGFMNSVIRDNITGVHYYRVKLWEQGTALTPLLDEDGKVFIERKEI